MDNLIIGGVKLTSRLFVGTGKYSWNELIPEVLKESGSKVITLAVRRVDFDNKEENPLEYIPKDTILLLNTSGARNAEEAIRLAKAMGCGNWIKIEVISDNKYLMPDNLETLKATEVLAKEGFVVLPYMSPDVYFGRAMKNAGTQAIMPLASPIRSNKGLKTKELIKMMIEEIDASIIVDAGIGRPSHAMKAMELGASACLVNTKVLKPMFPSIGIEIYALTKEEYKILVDAGVDSLTIYQETYNEKVYDKVHISGPKKDYRFRDAPEREKYGMYNIGLGALLGLSNFREDAFFTAFHGEYIAKKYRGVNITYALPRIRPHEGEFNDIDKVNDRNFV